MRKIFAIVLIALLLGVGVVAVIETDPGYVLLAYGNYTLETSLWVGLLLLVLLVILIYLALRLVYRLIGGQRNLVTWLGTRKAHHALRQSTRGLISYTEGNWSKARKQLENGAQNNEAPLINYLLAARSSEHMNEPEKVHHYLHAASQSESGAEIAVEITLAEMKLQAGQYDQALAALNHSKNNVARHPYAIELLSRIYRGMSAWDDLLDLLPELKKHKLLSHEEFLAVEQEVHGHRLEEKARSADDLRSAFQSMPARLKGDPVVLRDYVSKLVAVGAHDTAEKTILRALKQDWDSALVRQYGLVESANGPAQLTKAESWLAAHPEDEQLLMCLGRLSAREKLWGKARDYFESSYRAEHSAEICAELGRLLTALGEPKVAAAYFREGLLLREDELPELPMPDKIVHQGELLTRS